MAGVVAAALGTAKNAKGDAEGAVAAGVGGAVDADDGTRKGARQVKRAGVAADDARGLAQESHQRAKLAIVRHGIGVTTSVADGERKIILAGAVIHHAAEA